MTSIPLTTNVASLNARRRVGESTAKLRQSFERLSSGLRINKAGDDAAGLSIAAGLNADARVFTQGVQNLNDGISYLDIAEGATSQLKDILTRLKELAEQSANGVLSDAQRGPLQAEAVAIQEEYNRIVASTIYNGIGLFQAEGSRLVVQAGYGALGSIRVDLGTAAGSGTSQLGSEIARVSVDSSGTQANSSSNLASISADGRYVAYVSFASNLVAGDINGFADIFVHDRQTGQTTRVSVDSSGTEGNSASGTPSISNDGRYVAFGSNASNLVAGDTNGTSDIFVHDRQTGQTSRVSVDSSGTEGDSSSNIASISDDGRYVAVVSDASNLVAGDTNGVTDIFVTPNSLAAFGSTNEFSLTLLAGVDVSTQSAALATLDGVESYIAELSLLTSQIGSGLSRFETALANLQIGAANRRDAESRIVDADVAEDSATLVRGRILQQAGAAVLSSSNQQPSLVLELLRAA